MRSALPDSASRAARYLREARSQPGYGRRPEAMGQWSGLYVRLARKGLQGGWEGSTFAGHGDAVTCVGLSADGRLALSGSADRTLRLWEVETGQCLQALEGHGSGVTSACLTADGRFALSGGYCYRNRGVGPLPPNLRLWDLQAKREVYGLSEHLLVWSVAFSPDGRLVLSAGDD